MSGHYDHAGVDRLYFEIWGESIHYGLYETGAESIEDATRAAKRRMAEAAGLRPGMSVLEVGCGYGTTARHLAERHGVSVVATNVSDQQLRRCRELARSAGLGNRLSFQYADYHDLPFPDDSFDVWWCQEALVHSPDKETVLRQACRVLKPGGRAVISDQVFRVDRLSAEERAAVAARYHTPDLSGPADYEAHIAAAGLVLLERRDWQRHAATHRAKVLERLERRLAELAGHVDPATLDGTHRAWARWAELAAAGKLGFDFFLAEKPAR